MEEQKYAMNPVLGLLQAIITGSAPNVDTRGMQEEFHSLWDPERRYQEPIRKAREILATAGLYGSLPENSFDRDYSANAYLFSTPQERRQALAYARERGFKGPVQSESPFRGAPAMYDFIEANRVKDIDIADKFSGIRYNLAKKDWDEFESKVNKQNSELFAKVAQWRADYRRKYNRAPSQQEALGYIRHIRRSLNQFNPADTLRNQINTGWQRSEIGFPMGPGDRFKTSPGPGRKKDEPYNLPYLDMVRPPIR
jgi:hypothetical protein